MFNTKIKNKNADESQLSHTEYNCIDHIHMLVKIPLKLSVSQFMGYLKGKSAIMIFENHANLKYKYGQRTFWSRGYYGLNKEIHQETRERRYDNRQKKCEGVH